MQFKRSDLATYMIKYFSELKSAPKSMHISLIWILRNDLEDNRTNPNNPLSNATIIEMKRTLESLTSDIAIASSCHGDYNDKIDKRLESLLSSVCQQ